MALIKYPDGSASWLCDRCGLVHAQRFILLAAKPVTPPWGWSGDHGMTHCDLCTGTFMNDATASYRMGTARRTP